MLGQRLARILCLECKATCEASVRETELVTKIAAGYPEHLAVPAPLILYKAVGCPACGNTGYKGRCSIFEAVVIDNEVEEAVIRDPREHVILAAAEKQNIPTMAEDGIVKVLAGITSLEELERVVDLSNTRSTIATELSEPEGTIIDDFASHVVK